MTTIIDSIFTDLRGATFNEQSAAESRRVLGATRDIAVRSFCGPDHLPRDRLSRRARAIVRTIAAVDTIGRGIFCGHLMIHRPSLQTKGSPYVRCD
jgi:hypothetical protein